MSAASRRAVPAVVSLLVLCAMGGTVALTAILPDDSPVNSRSEASQDLQANADRVFERFNGSVDERNASGVLQAWSLNGATDECMAKSGFPEWDWSAARNRAPRTNALATSVFFSSPMSASYSNALRDMAKGSRQELALRAQELSEKETVAVRDCVNATPPASDQQATRNSVPATVAKLRDSWWAMLRTLDDKYGESEAYARCFEDAAADLPLDQPLTADSWKQYLATAAPSPLETPLTNDSPESFSPGWDRFLQVEADLEAVDWGCRTSTYDGELARVLAAVQQFEQDNEAAIRAAEADWQEIVARAEELGWHGQEGSVDRTPAMASRR